MRNTEGLFEHVAHTLLLDLEISLVLDSCECDDALAVYFIPRPMAGMQMFNTGFIPALNGPQ